MEHETFLEIEDSAQEAGVFVNGRTGKFAHMDSYGTVIEFGAFDAWWEKVKGDYDWKEFLEMEKKYEYLSPVIKLFGTCIGGKLEQGPGQ